MKGIVLNGIGYMPIPKVACTSIKNKFFQIKEGREFDPNIDVGSHIHQYWGNNLKDISNQDFKFIVIRDPIKRFLSAYSNRVCYHKELSREKISISNPKIAGRFEIYNPGLGQFIDNFNQYIKVDTIKHHCKPIYSWVDGDVSLFDMIYKLEDLNKLQADLSTKLNTKVIFPRDQAFGRKIPISDLSITQVDFLMEYYRKDYVLFKRYYNFDDFWKLWKNGY